MLTDRSRATLAAAVLPLQSLTRRALAKKTTQGLMDERQEYLALQARIRAATLIQALARRYLARGVALALAFWQIPRVMDPALAALDDTNDVPLTLWQQSKQLEFRVRGEDDYPCGNEYPHDLYFPSQFVSRSVLAGYVNGVKKKEHKFYDSERGSWPVITRQGNQLLDRRKLKRRIASEMVVVRYALLLHGGGCTWQIVFRFPDQAYQVITF